MKRIILFALSFINILYANAQYEYEFSRDVTRTGGNDNSPIVRVTVTSTDKKTMPEAACLSVLDTYIFNGIQGIDDGAPKADESKRESCEDFFKRVYRNKSTYSIYVTNFKEVLKPKRNDLGLFEATYTMNFNKAAFDRALKNAKIIEDKTLDTEATQIIMPSIMVVPYRQADKSYREVLQGDPDIRVAVAKVHEMMSKHGFETIDFEARLEATERSNEMEYGTADSQAAQIIKSSGADVYIVVDVTKDEYRNGNSRRMVLNLKCYNTGTGDMLSSKSEATRGTAAFDRLATAAVHRMQDAFMSDLIDKWNRSIKTGAQTVMLRITVDGDATIDLDSEIGAEGFGIADYIRSWLRKNAVKPNFHTQGRTATTMIVDKILIPAKTPDGMPQDPTDFAGRLTRFLRSKNISATHTENGPTIYLTISDL